ncbi:hypothetical protein Q3G72_001384 [Acer saccharum]|nr:hypothetical protein Q3G72_001384 [Acer saccharum]
MRIEKKLPIKFTSRMEDHLIGLNGMSADDGRSFDLDENELMYLAVITPLAKYKPHDYHLGLQELQMGTEDDDYLLNRLID